MRMKNENLFLTFRVNRIRRSRRTGRWGLKQYYHDSERPYQLFEGEGVWKKKVNNPYNYSRRQRSAASKPILLACPARSACPLLNASQARKQIGLRSKSQAKQRSKLACVRTSQAKRRAELACLRKGRANPGEREKGHFWLVFENFGGWKLSAACGALESRKMCQRAPHFTLHNSPSVRIKAPFFMIFQYLWFQKENLQFFHW